MTKDEAEALYDEHVTQSDFFLFSSSGNKVETLMEDIKKKHTYAGGNKLTLAQFKEVVNLHSTCEILWRIVIHYAKKGTSLVSLFLFIGTVFTCDAALKLLDLITHNPSPNLCFVV